MIHTGAASFFLADAMLRMMLCEGMNSMRAVISFCRFRRQISMVLHKNLGLRAGAAAVAGATNQIHVSTCGMSDRERQCGVLPYSLVPGAGGALDMALLLFRDPAGSNSLQSGRFFSELVCARDAVRL